MRILFPFPALLNTIILLAVTSLPACAPLPAPTKMSLEDEYAEEERAAESIATARAEETQVTAIRVSPYVEVSNQESNFLAFWFPWNNEHVLLPINEIRASDLDLVICQLDSDTEISSGILISGVKVSKEACILDEQARENASPIIEIPAYFDDGLSTEEINVIDLSGEYAENLADLLTLVIKNDLLGSGDLTLSLYPVDGPSGGYADDPDAITYTLPAEALQVVFTDEQMENFEYLDELVYALEGRFTWKIPPGYENLDLSTGDENWFVLAIRENGRQLDKAYLQIKGVGASIGE
jgi:hypothetical protein